ncbi:MAG: NAD-dependent epimerase/dehydratase family protein [Solirubrobacteraceae bacterium]
MSECLVVGGGFLGSHVAVRLADAGHRVTVYSRSFNDWLERGVGAQDRAIRCVEGTLPAGRGLVELIDAAEVVFYLGGTSTPTMAHTDPGGSITSFVVPAAALFDLMRATATRRIVLASSGGTVYGTVDPRPTREDHPTEPISIHGHNSLTVERYATFYARHHGFEPVILRYANPYGPGQLPRRGQGVIATWCDALARGEVLHVYGDPATRRDLLYVEDAAEATVRAGFEADGADIFNVGSGGSWSLAELLDRLERIAGAPLRIEHLPRRGVDVPATHLDCSRLRAATGWVPRTELDDGLRLSWEWARARVAA